MNFRAVTSIAAVTALAFAAGCARSGERIGGASRAISTGQAGGVYAPRNVSKYDNETGEKFVAMNFRAQRSVTATALQQRALEDGRLEVAANLRNRLNRRIELQVQCVFKDATGFSTGDETPWQTIILTENGQESVRFASMNDKAKDFTIRAREAR
jgi:hypothetical protein